MEPATEPVRLGRRAAGKRRISVSTIMAGGFGALVALAVASVLALTLAANYRNTVDLLGTRSALLVNAMEDLLRQHLRDPETAVSGIAKLYAERKFEIDDTGAMTTALQGALSSTPAATGLLIYTPDGDYRGAVRGTPREPFTIIPRSPVTDPEILKAMEARKASSVRQWGPFVRSQNGTYANVSMPLVRAGRTEGWIIAPVELGTLSHIARDLSSRYQTHAFILFDGDKVLADPALAVPPDSPDRFGLLAPVDRFGDPVLSRFSQREPFTEFSTAQLRQVEISQIRIPDADASSLFGGERFFVAISKQLTGYSPEPWTIGAYFRRGDISEEILRIWDSALVGLGFLVIALIAAVMLGRLFARPLRAMAVQAQHVADFDLDAVVPLRHSRVRELDEQASAFNAMLVGLRAFSTYIPRSLVAKLVRSGDADAAQPHEAVVTVMFTDIAGFTTLSETMDATETATLLNQLFAILCRAVDDAGGTVDKFIGDGMMAFFGAPDRLKGHAAAAARAAAAMREALAERNRLAAAEGRPHIRLRIGIHTGRVVVGNIGASDRVNYTIVGDTVNVSQRLEGLGKLIDPDAETAIVLSGETASRLDERFELTSAGRHHLRGRGEPIEVFLLGAVSAQSRQLDALTA